MLDNRHSSAVIRIPRTEPIDTLSLLPCPALRSGTGISLPITGKMILLEIRGLVTEAQVYLVVNPMVTPGFKAPARGLRCMC